MKCYTENGACRQIAIYLLARFLRSVAPKIALCAVYSEKQGKYPSKDVFKVSAVFERVLKCDG
jgi:hypothetical protein